MEEDYIKRKLDSIYGMVDRIDDNMRTKLRKQMPVEVQHSIIWATTLILLAIIITIAILL